MYEVICPQCKIIRQVRAKKPWMVGDSPYSKICKSCCQVGKVKSDEHKQKLSESIKQLQTEEVIARKSKFGKEHPENWMGKLKVGSEENGPWNKGKTLGPRTEETKKKISESTRGKKKNRRNK